MKKITGNKLLVKALKEEGVDIIFGYPGACTIDISDELSTVSIPLSDSVEVEAKSEPDPVLSPAIPSVEADVSSDPIYSPEEDDLSQSLYTEPESLVNETPEVPSVGSDFNIETMSESDPYAEENFAEPNYIEPSEPEMDASDVSANIINNFAKGSILSI